MDRAVILCSVWNDSNRKVCTCSAPTATLDPHVSPSAVRGRLKTTLHLWLVASVDVEPTGTKAIAHAFRELQVGLLRPPLKRRPQRDWPAMARGVRTQRKSCRGTRSTILVLQTAASRHRAGLPGAAQKHGHPSSLISARYLTDSLQHSVCTDATSMHQCPSLESRRQPRSTFSSSRARTWAPY